MLNNNNIEDFTLDNYSRIVKIALERYNIVSFFDNFNNDHALILRHDIDHSVDAALKIARIEAKFNIKSSFFFLLHSEMYSILEPETVEKIKEIMSLGHYIGLHFDVSFYKNIKSNKDLEDYIYFEKNIIEKITNSEIKLISFHSPNLESSTIDFRRDTYAELINTYSRKFFSKDSYISDSNGYWRFKRLEDILTSPKQSRLQVLIHPIWWSETPMQPRQRIQYWINYRAKFMGSSYDNNFLLHPDRMNIGATNK